MQLLTKTNQHLLLYIPDIIYFGGFGINPLISYLFDPGIYLLDLSSNTTLFSFLNLNINTTTSILRFSINLCHILRLQEHLVPFPTLSSLILKADNF